MDRRKFISKTSAGVIALAISPGCWACIDTGYGKESEPYEFKVYRPGKTLGKVVKITPDDGFYTNTYYTVCPWSPSQRFMAVTKFPYQDKITALGDIAEVCIVDVKKRTIRSVYKTKVWGYQLGADLHWGKSDRYLYTNDIINGKHAVGIRIDLKTGETLAYDGPMYNLNDTNGTIIGPYLEYMNISQYSYGTPAKDASKKNIIWPSDPVAEGDGIWKSHPERSKELLLSTAKASSILTNREYFNQGYFYFVSTRYNADYSKIMSVLRCSFHEELRKKLGKKKRNPTLITCNADGTDVQEVVSKDLWGHGHHPSWHPDGKHILMNLAPAPLGPKDLRFCLMQPDGSNLRVLSPDIKGSGHPTMRGDGRFILSDAYPFETMALPNGEVPIRLIDTKEEKEFTVCTIFTDLGRTYKMRRYWGPSKLDAHPVWSRNYDKICFNGAPEGKRQVFVADLHDFFT